MYFLQLPPYMPISFYYIPVYQQQINFHILFSLILVIQQQLFDNFKYITLDMQGQKLSKSFGNLQLEVELNTQTLIITVLDERQLLFYQKKYEQSSLPSSKTIKFKSLQEYFGFLLQNQDRKEIWIVSTSAVQLIVGPNDNISNILSKLNDQQSIKRLVIMMLNTQKDIVRISQKEDTNFELISQKLKKIGELVSTLNDKEISNEQNIQTIYQNVNVLEDNLIKQRQKINQVAKSITKTEESLRESIRNLDQSTQEKLQVIRTDFDIVQKTLQRNLTTFKEQFTSFVEKTEKNILNINQQIEMYNFPQIKRNIVEINQAFQYEIRQKQQTFTPDLQPSILNRKQLYFINKKYLKNQEDVKDYNKISGTSAIPLGRYVYRFYIKNIKSNGFQLGVCTKAGKQSLDKIQFNDRELVTMISSGYIINRGAMISMEYKLKSKDYIRMLVDTFKGEIRWICNEIEIGMADIGTVKHLELFPMIGLGCFGDEVEIISKQESKKQNYGQCYSNELKKLNYIIGKNM